MSANPLVQALCWTLVHSLWQGLIAALVAGIIVLATKNARPNLRYFLLTSLFFGLVLTCLGTFVWEAYVGVEPAPPTGKTFQHVELTQYRNELPPAGSSHTTWSITQQGDIAPLSGDLATQKPERASSSSHRTASRLGLFALVSQFMINHIQRWCNIHATLIVLVWTLILLLKCFQTLLHLGYIRRIRSHQNQDAPPEWLARLRQLANGIGLRRTIQLKESALVQVPMVIGYFKPIILIPLGILSGLPQDQLEAVLLHELAHIRRRDYLINILQTLAESLLFFNPAIWWISSLIRIERENCCDDVAISIRNKSHLIQALVAFQEYALESPTYAVAFPGRKRHLLDRVRRILYNSNKTLNAMEKTMLALGLIALCTFTLAFSPVNPNRALLQKELAHLKKATRHLLVLHGDTAPPVAPVAPVAPIAPISAVEAPVPAAPVPAAPVPGVAPSSPVAAPVAQPTAAIPPASPVAPLMAVIAPIGRTPAMDTAPISPLVPPAPPEAPSLPALPPPPPIPNELKGGNFKGTLDMVDGKITYIEGIWTNGKVHKYYKNEYKIVEKDGNVTAVYKDWKLVPLTDVDMQLIHDIIKELDAKEDGALFFKEYKHSSESDSFSGTGTFSGTSTSPTSSVSVSSGSSTYTSVSSGSSSGTGNSSTHTINPTDTNARIASQHASEASMNANIVSQNASVASQNARIASMNASVASQRASIASQRASVASQQASINSQKASIANQQASEASSGSGNSSDPNNEIAAEILKEHLAGDSLHLSFKLNYHELVINGSTQPNAVFNNFRNLFVKDPGDSYAYNRKGNNTTSMVSQNRSN